MNAVILSVGDELVLGQSVDTNSAFLSAQLAQRGIWTLYHQTVPDDQPAIARAIDQAARAAKMVIITGGLGPTDDDLTRQALAQAMGVDLVEDAASVEVIRGFFAQRGRPMPDRNRVQALHPRGSQILCNTCGTAPGIRATLHGATLYVTPGVPREMVVMFEKAIAPELEAIGIGQEAGRGVILTAKINTFGLGESTVGERLGPLMHRDRNPKVGTTVAAGVVSVRIRSEFPDAARAQAELDATLTEAEKMLHPYVYGREEQTLQLSLVRMLQERSRTLTTAESCTGGMLGGMVTDVAGSSSVYVGGWVTYANAMKTGQLDVPGHLIERHGAVSSEVAQAMARGAIQRSGADYSLAITGVAGPEGGTAEKPVGTVWIAVGEKTGADNRTDALCVLLPGERDAVRDRAAKCAMQMLRFHLQGLPIDTLGWGRR